MPSIVRIPAHAPTKCGEFEPAQPARSAQKGMKGPVIRGDGENTHQGEGPRPEKQSIINLPSKDGFPKRFSADCSSGSQQREERLSVLDREQQQLHLPDEASSTIATTKTTTSDEATAHNVTLLAASAKTLSSASVKNGNSLNSCSSSDGSQSVTPSANESERKAIKTYQRAKKSNNNSHNSLILNGTSQVKQERDEVMSSYVYVQQQSHQQQQQVAVVTAAAAAPVSSSPVTGGMQPAGPNASPVAVPVQAQVLQSVMPSSGGGTLPISVWKRQLAERGSAACVHANCQLNYLSISGVVAHFNKCDGYAREGYFVACPQCGLKFNQFKSMQKHLSKIHGTVLAPQAQPVLPPQPTYQFPAQVLPSTTTITPAGGVQQQFITPQQNVLAAIHSKVDLSLEQQQQQQAVASSQEVVASTPGMQYIPEEIVQSLNEPVLSEETPEDATARIMAESRLISNPRPRGRPSHKPKGQLLPVLHVPSGFLAASTGQPMPGFGMKPTAGVSHFIDIKGQRYFVASQSPNVAQSQSQGLTNTPQPSEAQSHSSSSSSAPFSSSCVSPSNAPSVSSLLPVPMPSTLVPPVAAETPFQPVTDSSSTSDIPSGIEQQAAGASQVVPKQDSVPYSNLEVREKELEEQEAQLQNYEQLVIKSERLAEEARLERIAKREAELSRKKEDLRKRLASAVQVLEDSKSEALQDPELQSGRATLDTLEQNFSTQMDAEGTEESSLEDSASINDNLSSVSSQGNISRSLSHHALSSPLSQRSSGNGTATEEKQEDKEGDESDGLTDELEASTMHPVRPANQSPRLVPPVQAPKRKGCKMLLPVIPHRGPAYEDQATFSKPKPLANDQIEEGLASQVNGSRTTDKESESIPKSVQFQLRTNNEKQEETPSSTSSPSGQQKEASQNDDNADKALALDKDQDANERGDKSNRSVGSADIAPPSFKDTEASEELRCDAQQPESNQKYDVGAHCPDASTVSLEEDEIMTESWPRQLDEKSNSSALNCDSLNTGPPTQDKESSPVDGASSMDGSKDNDQDSLQADSPYMAPPQLPSVAKGPQPPKKRLCRPRKEKKGSIPVTTDVTLLTQNTMTPTADSGSDGRPKRSKKRTWRAEQMMVAESEKTTRGKRPRSLVDEEDLPLKKQVRNVASSSPAQKRKMAKKKPDLEQVECGKCSSLFQGDRAFKKHAAEVHGCLARQKGKSQDFSEDEIAALVKDAFNKFKLVVCYRCLEKSYSTRPGLMYHLKNCGKTKEEILNEKVQCRYCLYRAWPDMIQRHELRDCLARIQQEKAAKKSKGDTEEGDCKDPSTGRIKRRAASRAKARVTEVISCLKQNLDGKEDVVVASEEDDAFNAVSEFNLPSKYEKMPKDGNGQKYRCKLCELIFSSTSEVEQHLMDVHGDDLILGPDEYSYEFGEDCPTEDDEESAFGEEPESDLDEEPFSQSSRWHNKANRRVQKPCRIKPCVEMIPREAAFRKAHFDKMTEDSFHTTASDWLIRTAEDVAEYLPKEEKSIPFTERLCSSNTPGPEQTLSRFEAVSSSKNCINLFTGGSIWAADWLPLSHDADASDQNQYLAISSDLSSIPAERVGRGLIQVWKFSPDFGAAECCLCIAHDLGKTWHLKWCPSGNTVAPSPASSSRPYLPRLGILSASCSDGAIHLMSVCQPESLAPNSAPGPLFAQLKSPCLSLVLTFKTGEPSSLQCLKHAWFRRAKHRIIAGAFSDGSFALWNIHTKPGELSRSGSKVLPYRRVVDAHRRSIRGIDFSDACCRYDPELPAELVTGSSDCTVSVWMLDAVTAMNSSRPSQTVKRGLVTEVTWLKHVPAQVAVSFDDGLHQSRTHSMIYEFSDGTSRTHPIIAQNSPIWSHSYNPWINMLIAGTAAGEVITFTGPQMDKSLEHDKDTKKRRVYDFRTEVDYVAPPENQEQCEEPAVTDAKVPAKMMPATIHFIDMLENLDQLPAEELARAWYPKNMAFEPLDHDPVASVNRVVQNTNRNALGWYFSGCESGIGRVKKFPM